MEVSVDLSTSIMTILSKILTIREEWLTLPDDCKHEVEILRSRLDNYQVESRACGQPGSSTMMRILEKAKARLKRVELRVMSLHNLSSGNHCCSYMWFWYAKLSIVVFPDNIKKILKEVNEDIGNIPKVLEEEGQISTQMRAAARRRPILATVNDIDSLYVPIDKAHSAVIKAIEHLQGPRLILLHGGVGKGKSTLARSMIQRYGKDTANGDSRSFENGNNQNDSNDGKAFDRVVWVSCGNCSADEISSKQLEILQDHSPNSLGDSPLEEKTNLRHRIAKALQEFFDDKKILMILDDISDYRFLYGMWKAATGGKASAGGKGVKILVTSQWRNICAKAGLKQDSCLIFMEDPMEDEAMKILASLVGLDGKCIPCHLQPTAKEMIKVTEGNPLALACLASHFAYSEDIEDQQAWQHALKGLCKLLDNPEEKLVLPVTVPGKHVDPRSLCGAMKICIDSLKTNDAKKILFFMYAFKEESTPELVLRILHGNLQRSNCTFSKSRDELRMRELLKIHQEPQQPPSLSLRSLVKLYMEHTKMVGDNEIKSLIDELLHDIEQAPESSSAEIKHGDEIHMVEWEKARVAITLCALYFNGHNPSIKKILAEAMTQANVTYSNDDINDLRREAIYPILSLIDEPENEHWKESDVSSTRQVFLTYICKHKLDNENISHLLELAASTAAQLATLKAICQIFTVEKESLLKDNNFNFLHPIVHLLDVNRGVPMSLLEEASKTLYLVCWKASQDQSTSLVTNMPGVLDMLVYLISFPIQQPNVVAENAAKALWSLSYSGGFGKTANFAILEKKGALINLAKCLSEHGNPGLQRGAAGALVSLAFHGDTSLKLRIANEEGVLHSLVKLMSSHETPASVQAQATQALRNLACAEDNVLKLQIVNEDGALEGLVKLLSTHDKPNTQELAAASLGNLACNADSFPKVCIANHEGVLHNLVKLMSSDELPPNVRVEATRALRNLANTEDDVLKLRIVNEEGTLEGLVKLLSTHNKSNSQEHAAAGLENLARNANCSLKVCIANHEGLLHNLVKLMSSNETLATVRVNATRALQNLANADNDILKLQIVSEEGVLEGLVKLLSTNDKPNTQQHAAASLGNLACNASSSLKVRIANHEGVLHNLVKLMSSNETLANVQVEATRAVRNLVGAADNVLKLRVVNEEGALEGLVKLLSMHNKLETQEHAATTLGNLACNADSSLKVRIANHEGVLHNLVKLMCSNETLPNARGEATWALLCLANTGDDVLKLRIVNEEGALEGLVKLLSMHDKPNTQEHAAASLGNLAGNANSSLKVCIANHEGVLHNLVKLMASNETVASVRVGATRALRILANTEDDIVKLRIVNEEGALGGLVKLLSMHDKPNTLMSLAVHDHSILQEHAGWVLCFLAKSEEAKVILEGTEGLLKGLSSLLADCIAPEGQYTGAYALTLINPTLGKEASLSSEKGYLGRVEAFIFMGMFEEALHDLGFAVDLLQGANMSVLCLRLFVKAKLGDLDGALYDANEAVKVSNSDGRLFALQKRGVVKQMLGDLQGSLADLNEALLLDTEDYEVLKHRGRVKFMLRDEEGARADAELALKIKPPSVDGRGYERQPVLGCCPAEYLGYKLK